MKTAQSYFAEYNESHQNSINQFLHKICVPLIFWSILSILWELQTPQALQNIYLNNYLLVVALPILFFYFKLGIKYFFTILIYSFINIALTIFIAKFAPIIPLSIAIFVLAWIGQFYGHHVEGKRPSFFKDLLFLLIGPIWVIQKTFNF